MIKYSLGIDVSKDTLDICLSSIDVEQRIKVIGSRSKVSNTSTGFDNILSWVESKRKETSVPLVVVMEATGIYYENIAFYLSAKGYHVSVVLPNHSKRYMESIGVRSKNDAIDAQALSRMGAERYLEEWTPLPEFMYQLRSMTRSNQQLKEMKVVLDNQLHSKEFSMYSDAASIQRTKRLIELLEMEIKANEKEIKSFIHQEESIKENFENICSIKGVGLITAATIIAETNGFSLFKNHRQLVSFAGYDVVENQSGKHIGKTKISKKGNSRIRRVLYMASLSLLREKVSIFRNLFDRTYAKHGIYKKSNVAVQRKLLCIIYTLWKKKEKFSDEYNNTIKDKELVYSSLGDLEKVG